MELGDDANVYVTRAAFVRHGYGPSKRKRPWAFVRTDPLVERVYRPCLLDCQNSTRAPRIGLQSSADNTTPVRT